MSAAPSNSVPSRGRIPCLDGLRAFSILLVFIAHATWAAHLTGKWGSLLDRTVYPYGITGVSIFFVISGYLITHLLIAEWKRTGGIALLQFYRRRVLRIFPAFYSYLLLICLLCFAGILTVPATNILHAATFTANFYRDSTSLVSESAGAWYVAHFWSLAYEEQYYLVWPAMLLLLGPARAIFFPLALILLTPAIRLGTHWPLPASEQIIPELYRYYEFLMIGSLAAMCEGQGWFESFFKKLHGIIPLGCTLFLLAMAPVLRHLGFHQQIALIYQYTFQPEIDAACIAIVLLWLVRHSQSGIGRLLEHPAIVYVGVMSYSLYVWQQLFLSASHANWIGGKFPFNVLLAIGMAEISYRYIEKPFRKSKRTGSHEPLQRPEPVVLDYGGTASPE
jgi:peptidoglycan/LPS O-acetylase OafA/YrhL